MAAALPLLLVLALVPRAREARLGAEQDNVRMLSEQVVRLERVAGEHVRQAVSPLEKQKEAAEQEALELARRLRLFEDERAQLEGELQPGRR